MPSWKIDAMIEVPGYTVVELLGETDYSSVYRARTEGQAGSVIIKVIRTKEPSAAEIARFRHEYNLIRAIHVDGIVKTVDFIECEGRPALVLEDFGGISLKTLLAAGFTLQQFLGLAIRLARILGSLHQNNISHCDIKPSNILWNPESDILKITDFGISVAFAQGYEKNANPIAIEGTLAYISPEQTGRMNCGVDYRTDLYSLGVSFYEMLTGQVPFPSKNPMETIHGHIAKLPVPPCNHNSDVPGPVSDIVMKLLAKAAAERYQNGLGLAADLDRCLHQLNTTGRIEPFPLGSQDISLRFFIPQQLVGREEQLERLLAAFDRVRRGATEVILVAGEPGIGKSALVSELHKPIVANRGYFIAGKFDQFHRAVPYSAVIQAFQSLARQLLAENDERLRQWKHRLLAALEPNGKIITDAIAEIELIIGKQPEIPALGPEEARNRFNLVFKSFVRVFADQSHPLVLFMDDLQWADTASLHLLETVATDPNQRFLLFIGAYRDQEVAAHHPFMLTRDAMAAAGRPIHTIDLGALDAEEINRLIVSFLRCAPGVCLPLAQAVHAKTKGNPFFVNQFLKTLHDQRHLILDPAQGWSWDLNTIRQLQVTDNVVQFLADRLQHLPADHLEIIQICACIGNRFDLETLAFIPARTIQEVLSVIDALMQDGLINRSGDLYRFHHDRIQEAAYSLLSQVERERLHYRIGKLELDRTSAEQLFNRIFYICDQLNQAHRLIATQVERTRLADLNLMAGLKAKESAAYAAAVSYLVTGGGLLAEDAWQSNYELAFALRIEQMECQYLNRNFDEAERLFDIVIKNAKTKIDKAKAYAIMTVLYTNMRGPKDAIALGLKALDTLFGIRISPDVGGGAVLMELIKAKRKLSQFDIETMVDLPIIEDEEINACLQLIVTMVTPAYYISRNLFAKLSLKGFNLGLTRDHVSKYASGAYISLATIIQTGFGDYELGYRLGDLALKFSERIDHRKTAGMMHYIFAFFIQHWKRHARYNIDIYRKAYQLSMNTGDFIYAGHSINATTTCRLLIGARLDDILEENNKYKEFMNIVQDPFIAARYQENNQLILNLKGQAANRHILSGPDYDGETRIRQLYNEKNFFGLGYTLLYKLKVLYLCGKYEEARQAATELNKHIKVQMGTQLVAEYYFYYSLILTALILEGAPKSYRYKVIVHRNQRKMHQWASLCPENFRHKYDLVAAERMRGKGRDRKARELYHAAIEGARQNEYLHVEALACERLALFNLDAAAREEAKVFMQRACRCYASWGATAKVDDLRERHPDLVGVDNNDGPADIRGGTTSSESASQTLDLSTVLQVSQVISSEIMLDGLLQKTMHMSITNAGAQRGYLILESDGRLSVQASEDVNTGQAQVLQAVPLEACDGLSPAIVNYVYHGGQPLILGNASLDGAFINDPHVLKHRCKSILCMSIMNKGLFACVLYMENNLTADAFTPERLAILRIISAQAAISLQNAQLYEHISKEISVRKQAEESMRISEEKYRTILEEVQDAYCEMDLKGAVTFVNPAVCTLTGCGEKELIGSNVGKRCPESERRTIERYFHEIYKTGMPGKPLGCNLIGKNGAMICLEIVASLIRDKSGQAVGFRSLARDISERRRLEHDLFESYKNVQTARTATILGLAKLAEYRDEATGAHLERIREYSRIIARELATKADYQGYITSDYIEDIYTSAILHDIGKVGVPDAILLKPGKLTKEEFEIIKTHSALGGDALQAVDANIEGQTFLTLGKEIAYYHHEKWDGSGYPKGLKAEAIPLSARIVALADVYDALTSKRTYKEAFSHQKAVGIITNDRGTHFAPDVVDAFLAHAEEFHRIREEMLGG